MLVTGTHMQVSLKRANCFSLAVLELISNKASKSKPRQTFNVLEAISFSFLSLLI